MTTEIVAESQRVPTLLWESLQDLCVRQDQKFITDVSHILGIPAAELKKKVFGTRGVSTTVLVEHGPWWSGLQCSVMERQELLWTRCSSMCESGDTCMKHRNIRNGWNIRRYDDPYFTDMSKRRAVHVEGVVYWVSEEGDAVDTHGVPVPGIHIDIKTRTAHLRTVDTKETQNAESPPPSPAAPSATTETSAI